MTEPPEEYMCTGFSLDR
ncbi:hypothetical protein F383_38291 [Gossypium arboreum]|uniref:Uncharacterized protein n=1 Tax=Gossypium arboreum TaxID=29729 RepID=A0A0B0MJH5_GOSAR|nr:hypothetical protein F383_38291 [Gossypium arboreum]